MSDRPAEQLPMDVYPIEVKQLLREGNIVLIDCREQDEWEAARIEGAVLMPMSNWANEVANLHAVRRCAHCGALSSRWSQLAVANWMRQNGFPRTQNMVGGIDAWSEQVDPSVPKY